MAPCCRGHSGNEVRSECEVEKHGPGLGRADGVILDSEGYGGNGSPGSWLPLGTRLCCHLGCSRISGAGVYIVASILTLLGGYHLFLRKSSKDGKGRDATRARVCCKI